MNPCVLIPIYNHKDTIAAVVANLAPYRLPCIIVDDGSDTSTQQVLAHIAARYTWVQVLRLEQNSGKGQALCTGFSHTYDKGYSHAIQIDADGQHDTQDIERFLAEARAHPTALVLGKPIFGADVPLARYFGRKISQWLVWGETLSCAIGDPLFGFRMYPLAATVALLKQHRIGARMDFEPDIAVRLYWAGVAIRNVETRVFYPAEGLSHFRMLRDNVRISWLHTRLLAGMLIRIPQLLRRQ
ncbi:MAG: glycosyltransferase family 2 protein [Deltaproteobacteria bacterium]|nr:glycosyltransferase family 2 protein [Deltaproteobacteria bacterium]